MIWAVRHSDGAVAWVKSLEGHDDPDWTVIGTLPADVPAELAMIDADDQIVADLPRARALRIEALRQIRDARQSAGCMTPLGRMQSDPISRGLLNGAVTAALVSAAAGQPYSVDWTMENNAIVTHDGPAIIAAGMAVLEHVAAEHAIFESLRAQVNAAITIAAIDAVTWPD